MGPNPPSPLQLLGALLAEFSCFFRQRLFWVIVIPVFPVQFGGLGVSGVVGVWGAGVGPAPGLRSPVGSLWSRSGALEAGPAAGGSVF